MPLLLTEADVRSLLTMPLVLELAETSFRRLGDGSAVSHTRRRLHIPGRTVLNYMAASDLAGGYLGLKIYSISRGKARFVVPLFLAETGELVALIEADYLGQMRTGAASGVAARLMARKDARTAGIIGTGLQARTQLEAVVLARKFERICAFGRDAQRREKFAKEMTEKLGVVVTPVASAEEAVRGADVLITSTTSKTPIVEGQWIAPGTHINAIGSNFAEKRELNTDAIRRCDVIAADSVEQSKVESGDLIQGFAGEESRWASVREFAAIVTGRASGRTSDDQVTLFKSNGIALEDVVTAGKIYEMAREQGIGRKIPLWSEGA